MQVRRQWSHIFKILGAGVGGECQLNILGLAGSEIPLPHQEAADSPAWEIPSATSDSTSLDLWENQINQEDQNNIAKT